MEKTLPEPPIEGKRYLPLRKFYGIMNLIIKQKKGAWMTPQKIT